VKLVFALSTISGSVCPKGQSVLLNRGKGTDMKVIRGFAMIATGAIVGIGLITTAGNAEAAPYPPVTSCAVAVSSTAPSAGSSITVTGTNFAPGTVSLTLGGAAAGSPTAAQDGSFSTTVAIGADASGTEVLSANGGECTSSVNVTVATQVKATTISALANTGFAVMTTSVLGGLAILLGSVLILTGRRRKGSE
jgi:hypothetical protein